jgi:hypothetical protein
MTAYTIRLPGAFPENGLPFLRNDPVIPPAGGRYLIDAASTLCTANLTSSLVTVNPYDVAIPSLTRDGIATTGASIGDQLFRGENRTTTGSSPADMEDRVTNRFRGTLGWYDGGGAAPYFWFPDQPEHPPGIFAGIATAEGGERRWRFIESADEQRYPIDDCSHSYAFCLWVTLDPASAARRELFGQNFASTSSSDGGTPNFRLSLSPNTLRVGRAQSPAFRDWYRSTTGSTFSTFDNWEPLGLTGSAVGVPSGVLFQLAYGWEWNGTSFDDRLQVDGGSVLNRGQMTNWNIPTASIDMGQGRTIGGVANGSGRTPFAAMGFGCQPSAGPSSAWFGSGHKLHRLYIEDLTRSGRTFAQCAAADRTAVGSKFD